MTIIRILFVLLFVAAAVAVESLGAQSPTSPACEPRDSCPRSAAASPGLAVEVEEFTLRETGMPVVATGMAQPRRYTVRAGRLGARVGWVPVDPGEPVDSGEDIMVLDGLDASRRLEDARLCKELLARLGEPLWDQVRAAYLPQVTTSRKGWSLDISLGASTEKSGSLGVGISSPSKTTTEVTDPARAAERVVVATEKQNKVELEALRCRRLEEDAKVAHTGLRIVAETRGWVKEFYAEAGDVVPDTGRLLLFEDPSSLEVEIPLTAEEYHRIPEQHARCTVSWHNPHSNDGEGSDCAVTRMLGETAESGLYQIAVQVFDPPKWISNDMQGTVRIETGMTRMAGFVAFEAIVADTTTGVFVVRPDRTVERVTVKIGSLSGDGEYIEVFSPVLKPGDLVVRGDIVSSLEDGVVVDPVSWTPSFRQEQWSDHETMHSLARSLRMKEWPPEPPASFTRPGTLSALPLAAWRGVTATPHDVVTGLTLAPPDIAGPLSPDVSRLDSLRFLVTVRPSFAQPRPVFPVPREITRLRLDSLDLPSPLCVPADDDGINAWLLTIPGARAQTCVPLSPPQPVSEPTGERERRVQFKITGFAGTLIDTIFATPGWEIVDVGFADDVTWTQISNRPGIRHTPSAVFVEVTLRAYVMCHGKANYFDPGRRCDGDRHSWIGRHEVKGSVVLREKRWEEVGEEFFTERCPVGSLCWGTRIAPARRR